MRVRSIQDCVFKGVRSLYLFVATLLIFDRVPQIYCLQKSDYLETRRQFEVPFNHKLIPSLLVVAKGEVQYANSVAFMKPSRIHVN